MEYRHAPAADHGALDAVLVSAPGRPTLPVRLTLELFGRALAFLPPGPVTVWDPCCGAGTTLAVLGLCRGAALSGLVGSDVDPSPLDLARRNLALLDSGGLDARAADLEALAERHGKPGYASAAASARTLHAAPIPYSVALADATDPVATAALVSRHPPQVVIADLPHGIQTGWSGAAAGAGGRSNRGSEGESGGGSGRGSGGGSDTGAGHGSGDPASELVAALAVVLAPDTVIALAGRGRTLALPPGTRTLDRIRVGHRAAVILRAGDVPARS